MPFATKDINDFKKYKEKINLQYICWILMALQFLFANISKHSIFYQISAGLFMIISFFYLYHKNAIKISKYHLIMLIFIFYNLFLIISGIAINKVHSFSMLKTLGINFILSIAIYSLLIKVNDTVKLLKTYVYISVLSNSVILFLFRHTLLNGRLAFSWGSSVASVKLFGVEVLTSGPNGIAYYSALAFIFSTYLFFEKGKKKKFLFYNLLFIVTILLTGSRKGIIMLFFGFVILLSILIKGRKKFYYLIGAVIIAIIVFFVSQYIPALYEITGARLEQFINLILGRSVEDASINTRLSLIDMTIKLIVKRPILGYGLDSFRIIGPWGIVADNNFLEILVSSGIIGFVIYYSYLFFIIHDYFSIKKKSKICKILFFIFILTLGMEIGSVTYFERNFMFTNIITYYILYKEMKENDMINKNSNIRNKIFEKLSSIWHVDYIQQFVPSRLYLKIQYKNFMGKKLNFKNPKTFNEKLQWLKVYDKNPEYTNLVDKYEVRKHIENIIGEEYLIPLIGVYDSFDDIPFQKLPKKFVLKSTHTSGNVFICKNKANINYSELEFKINEWLERKYYWVHREWPYKNIKPRIICEEYIVDESGIDLKDYKFMCFNGQPKIIQVMSERSNGNYRINHFDLEWNRLELPRKKYYENDKKISKPKDLKKMIEISKKLSQSIPFSRIDLYQTTKGVFFGEVTFFPVSGYMDFQNEKDDYLLGSWIDLPN